MLDLESTQSLKVGDIVYCIGRHNPEGDPHPAKVTGVKRWARLPKVELHLCFYRTFSEKYTAGQLHYFTTDEQEARRAIAAKIAASIARRLARAGDDD